MRLPSGEYATRAMEPIDPHFASEVEPGGVIVAETNFGIDSSREHVAIALKELGIGAVVAVSFARIFYRNAINNGIPVIECSLDNIRNIDQGDVLSIDLVAGEIYNETKDESYEFPELTDPVKSILEAGGAVEYYSQGSDR